MLEIKNISAGYGNTEILHNVSLSLKKGNFISVIGPNGSGKSTLLKALVGINPIASGNISIDGDSIPEMSRRAVAEKIAYLSQGRNVPNMTVGQLVLHGRFPHLNYPRRYTEKDRRAVRLSLEQLGISSLYDRPLSSLSGGMRQNAYIAMSLVQDTDYILLDEPTSYLDISHQLELMKTLKRLSALGKGIVAVLHDLPLAFAFSDSIVVLKDGSVATEGTPDEIYKQSVIREVFGIELAYSEEEKTYRYKYSLE